MGFQTCKLFSSVLMFVLFGSAHSYFPLMSDTPSHKCDMECNTESVPVCGNDGRTYESRCEIERAKCQGHPVEFKHRGKCIGKGIGCCFKFVS
ncbi:u5-Austrotoxin-Ht1a_1 [Trichonephila clavata]|uniref:U5-Austrotoxin-Ht1a_1 n=1 Tax=Trichonephila clavata TaxID=2740835 RepID=A0A8X6EZ12_TRICU|nr:u5-Austrotoxin-Ht1a_1 [Trichonephila clavata]